MCRKIITVKIGKGCDMNISQNTLNFKSKYQLDVNQEMPNEKARHYRDSMFGYYTGKAKNCDEIVNFIFNQADKSSDNAHWNVTIDLPDKFDKDFESDMNQVGQKFNKIV